jgi:hypothetical protein
MYKLMKGIVEDLLEKSLIFASEDFQNYWFGGMLGVLGDSDST